MSSCLTESFNILDLKNKKIKTRTVKHFFEHDRKIWSKIKKIKNEPFTGTVYNCEVEDMHSYLAHNYIVHNSLELVLNRRLGSYHLPKGWMIISAGNMADDKAHIFEMSAPLRARFKHFELQVPTIEEWSAWAMEHGINPNIVAFLNFKPEYLHKFNEDSREESFPNPRSWMFASKSIDGITDIKFIEREVASCVGKGVAMEFSAWYKMNDKVDLNAIIKAPETVKKIREMSLKYSIVAGLAEKYKANKDIFDSVLAVCKHIEPEFGYILLGYVKTADRNAFAKKVVSSKIWKEIASIYGKYMDD
jgi:hypothetical protein